MDNLALVLSDQGKYEEAEGMHSGCKRRYWVNSILTH
jgi:hypothetical protein